MVKVEGQSHQVKTFCFVLKMTMLNRLIVTMYSNEYVNVRATTWNVS